MSKRSSSSFWRRPFGRGPKSREQDDHNVPGMSPALSVASIADKDAAQISTTALSTGRDVSPARPSDISPPGTPRPAPSHLHESLVATDVANHSDASSPAMGLPAQLWDRAYDELKREDATLVGAYEKILSRQLQDGLGSPVPESQPNAIAQHDPHARRSQMDDLVRAGMAKIAPEAKLKDGAGAAMKVVLSIKDVISTAVQAAPQAALPWAGVCVALEMLTNPMTATETNRHGIVHITKRMDWYWSFSDSLFKESVADCNELSGIKRELGNHFVDLYKAFLSYQMKSVYSYYRHRGLVFLRDMVKLDDWKGDLNAIQDAEEQFRRDSDAYTTQQQKLFLEQLVSYAKNQEVKQMSDTDHQCLVDVRRDTDPYHDKKGIEEIKGGLLQGSYRWILDNLDFQRWRDDPEARFLWIKGDPGKGKTMLLCGIVDEMARSNTPALRSFFFCRATDNRINNATAVLRGLIYLLVDKQPSLVSHVRKKYDHTGKPRFHDANTWIALSEIFTNILQDPIANNACLIVDALDECVDDLPKLLKLIVQSSSFSTRVKWLLSSRNEPGIERELKLDDARARLSLELKDNAKHVSHAVDLYIDDKLAGIKPLQDDDQLRDQVRTILHRKANGTFLWVALVVQELAKAEIWEVLDMANELPTGLYDLYDRMLDRIQQLQRNSEFCRLVLATAVVTYRPLYILELGIVSGLSDKISKYAENVRKIVSMCGSFLTIRDDQVYFVHQSAKDYLVEKASTILFPSGASKTHYSIFKTSLKLMSDTLKRDMYHLDQPGCSVDRVSVPDPDPLALARYPCVYWVDHLCRSLSSNTKDDDDLRDGGTVHTFLEKKYLYWLEALSLLRSMSEGVMAVRKLEELPGHKKGQRLTDLIRDAHRFILSHRRIIENAPLQAYTSALIFSPVRSIVRELFKAEEPSWITLKPVVEENWNTCLQTLEGHDEEVYSVAFSADGNRVVSGSADDTIKIWDAKSGACVQTLKGHDGEVGSVVFSADGNRVVSGSCDDTIKIWDTGSGACVQTLEGHDDEVCSVAFSADGNRVVSGSADRTIKIWDAKSGTCVQTLKDHGAAVWSVAFSADSNRVVSGLADKTIKIWDTGSGACVQTLEGHDEEVCLVAFSADGNRVVSGSADDTIKIWDAKSGACVQTLEGHGAAVNSVAFPADGNWVVLGSCDKTIKIWNMKSGACVQTLEGHGAAVNSVVLSADGNRVVSGSDDKTIKIWDMRSGACIQTLKGHSEQVISMVFSADGNQVVSGSCDDTIKIWDTGSGACVQTLKGHDDEVCSVAFSADGIRVVSGSADRTIKIWDAKSGTCVQTLKDHGAAVWSVAFSADSNRVVSGSADKTIKIWDTGSGACVQTLEGHGAAVNSVAFSANGNRVVSGSGDNNTIKTWDTIKIWDVESGTCVEILKRLDNVWLYQVFSADGDIVASGLYDNTIKIWDMELGGCVQTLEGHSSQVRSMVFSADDNRVVSGSDGYSLNLDQTWITQNGQNVLWLPVEYRPTCCAVQKQTVSIGCSSGQVFIFRFSLNK